MMMNGSRRVRLRISKEDDVVVGEDRFEVLPDELILKIMESIKDAKTLVRCLPTCKRFASLAPLTRSVSVSIHRPKLGLQCAKLAAEPYNISQSGSTGAEKLHIILGVGNNTVQLYSPIGMWWPWSDREADKSRSLELRGLEQFNCFKEIRNVRLKFSYGDIPYRCHDVTKWKVEVSDRGIGIKSCVVLEWARFDYSESEKMMRKLRTGWRKNRVKWISSMMKLVWEIRPTLAGLMRDHPTVRDIAVYDVSGKGEIHAGEEMRGAVFMDSVKELLSMKTWFVPLAELSEPIRCVFEEPDRTVKGAMVTVVQELGPGRYDHCAANLVRSAFGDDVAAREMANKMESLPCSMMIGTEVQLGH